MDTATLLKIIQEAIHTRTKEHAETRFEDRATLLVQFSDDKYRVTVQRR